MPILKNKRHEAFSQHIVVGGLSGKDAYLKAGFKCSERAAESSASDLLRNPKIQARIAELSETLTSHAENKFVLTKNWVILEMVDLYRMARKNAQVQAATRCLELLGREVKAFVERKNITVRDFAEMDDDEIANFLAEREAEQGNQARPN